jgi:hypothetical protein
MPVSFGAHGAGIGGMLSVVVFMFVLGKFHACDYFF